MGILEPEALLDEPVGVFSSPLEGCGHFTWMSPFFSIADLRINDLVRRCHSRPMSSALSNVTVLWSTSLAYSILLWESIRACIWPSSIRCISSSSRDGTLVLKATDILFISADRYGEKYWINARFLMWEYRTWTCCAKYRSRSRLSLSSSRMDRHEAYFDSWT